MHGSSTPLDWTRFSEPRCARHPLVERIEDQAAFVAEEIEAAIG
jgi:hypothetical protein